MPIRHALTFPATLDGLRQGADGIRRALDEAALPDRARYNIELVFEEVVTNIIRYGQTRPAADIDAWLELDANEAILTIEDTGEPFDPREQPDPARPQSLDEAKVGGLGLMLVRKVARRIEYERTSQQRNRLIIAIPKS